MNRMTTGLIGVCLGLGAAGVATAQTRELGASGQLLDGIAALVDTGVVLKSDLRRRIQEYLDAQSRLPPEQRTPLPPIAVLEQRMLDQLIDEELQVQRAQRVGIAIGDDELNQIMAEYARSVGTTLEQFPVWLESEGVDYRSFREDQRRDLMIRTLELGAVVNPIRDNINPRELEQCLARAAVSATEEFEYHTSHILIAFPLDATPDQVAEAEARARDLVRQLDAGADFAELALAHSESPTALEGGSLGWRQGAALPTFYPPGILSMEAGAHTAPIRTSGGFHIVRLNEMRGAEPELVDQVRARHILLEPTEVLDDDATLQRIEGIREQIAGGDDFATVAEAVSDDALSAVDGGDLGWQSLGEFDPAFQAVVASLEVGELSEPFRTSYGWHLAEVIERRNHDVTDERREQACRAQIGNSKVVEESDLWRRRLRDEAYIVKRL